MSGALRFDLARGRVSSAGVSALVILPAEALSRICEDLGAAGRQSLGAELGTELGRRVAERLGSSLERCSTEEFVEHLGAELALMGLGSLGVEYWGAALVFCVTHSPLSGAASPPGGAGDELFAALLGGALQRAMSRQVSVLAISRSDRTARFLVCSSEAQGNVESWLGQGADFAQVLARLNASEEA